MTEQPLVTVGIINYNGKKYLMDCVRSYLKQSYGNLEIILIDDCSADGSVELLRELEKNNQNIRCIYHEKNSGGPSRGIQEIIREAKGKYFQWIASDDYAESNAIEKLTAYLEATDNDYVYCNLNVVNDNNAVISRWNYTVPTLNEMVYRIFTTCCGVIPMNGLYRLDFFHKNRITWSNYENNEYSGDTINSLYFIENGMKYGLLKESLINYRLHQDNRSHNIEERIKTSLTVYDYIIKHFDEAIYLPNIQWNKHDHRGQLKNYSLAQFFYNRIVSYLQLGSLPRHLNYTVSKEKLKECIRGFVEEGLRYIREGLAQGDTLKNELVELQKGYEKLL